MKLYGCSNEDIDQNKDGEDTPKLELVEVVLVHCNVVYNNYQQVYKVLLTPGPNKQFGQLINISPHSLITLNTTSTEFPFIEVWFIDQNSKNLR